jgi:hypothetical protein
LAPTQEIVNNGKRSYFSLKFKFFYVIGYEKGKKINILHEWRRRMIKKKILVSSFLLLLIFSFSGFTFSQQGGTLERITVTPLGDTLEVKIFLSPYTYHRQFRLYNPSRVGIDLFNVRSISASRNIDVSVLGIKSISVSPLGASIARVFFYLEDEFPPYITEKFAGGLKIVFWTEEKPPIVEEKVEVTVEKIEEAICDIKVQPTRANANDPIFIDVSGSQYAESMVVEVFDPEGTKIASKELFPESPQWEVNLDKPGEYTFKGKAFNIEGKASENPCEATVSINFSPSVNLECRKCEGTVGKKIILDASGSTDPDGEVVQVDFEIIDEEGSLVDRFSDTEKPFIWEKAFNKKGIFSVTAVATDDLGSISEPSMVDVRITQKKMYFLLDVGALAARGGGTYVGYGSGRAGILYKLSKNLDIILAGGGAYTPVDSDPWEQQFFTGTLIFNLRAGSIFIGLGGAYTTRYKTTIQNDYGEVITNIGFDLFGKSRTTISIFLEASGPPVDLSIQDNHKLMLGFRLLF